MKIGIFDQYLALSRKRYSFSVSQKTGPLQLISLFGAVSLPKDSIRTRVVRTTFY